MQEDHPRKINFGRSKTGHFPIKNCGGCGALPQHVANTSIAPVQNRGVHDGRTIGIEPFKRSFNKWVVDIAAGPLVIVTLMTKVLIKCRVALVGTSEKREIGVIRTKLVEVNERTNSIALHCLSTFVRKVTHPTSENIRRHIGRCASGKSPHHQERRVEN